MMSLSLDGFFAGPGGGLDWQLVDHELHQHFNDELRGAGAFLDGRVTYELMAGYWPTADADPASPAPIRDFAAIWREMPKLVFSRTLDQVEGNTTIVREVDPARIAELKAQAGGDLFLGGGELAAAFMRHDLIDEYRLYAPPVVIGEGRRLFPPDARIDVALAETRAFGNGVVLLRYRREPRA